MMNYINFPSPAFSSILSFLPFFYFLLIAYCFLVKIESNVTSIVATDIQIGTQGARIRYC